MSVDNYILIRKEETIKYVGYEESASAEAPSYARPVFVALTLKDAILHAQSSEMEYGYRFEWGEEDAP
jgi:hypothetical protein